MHEPVSVYRLHDGYSYQGDITAKTPKTVMVQLPGFSRPIRFYMNREGTAYLHNVYNLRISIR